MLEAFGLHISFWNRCLVCAIFSTFAPMSNKNTNYLPRRDCLHQLFKIEVLCSRFPSLIPIKKKLKLTLVSGGGGLFILMRSMKLKPNLILCKSRKLPHSYSHSIPHTSKRKKCISFQVNLIYMKSSTAPINTKRSAGWSGKRGSQ